MASTHTDEQLRGNASLLRQLFPEHTKTVPRIIAWSVILLLDLLLGAVVVWKLGIDLPELHRKMELLLQGAVLLGVSAGAFLAESLLWRTILRLFR